MAKGAAVVTGGAGFLGSHLVERLIRDGWRVRVLDDLSAGRLRNLAGVRNSVQIRKASILDEKAVDKAVSGADTVFHMAAKVSVAESFRNPELYAQVNVAGLIQILEAARRRDVRRLVFPSSAAVYAEGGPARKTESSALSPRSPYAVTKVLGEALCKVYYENHDLQTVSLRLFNVYGARQDPSSPYASVIPRFLDALSKGRRPVIFGDGKQTRDFIHVDDAVNAIVLASTKKKAAGEVINVASGNATSILRLLQILKSTTNWKAKPKLAPARPGEVRHSCASVERARHLLGFKPTVPLDEGLRRLAGGNSSH